MKLTLPLWVWHLILALLFLAFSFLFRGLGWNFLPFFPVIALGLWHSPRPVAEVFRLLPFRISSFPQGLCVFRSLFFLGLGIGGWIFVAAFLGAGVQILLPLPDEFAGYLENLLLGQSFLRAFFIVGLGAPLFEEALCRGIIAGDLKTQYSAKVAIGFSALVFAFLHLNPWQGIPAFLTGLIFGWVYLKGQGLLYSLWGHSVYNTFILLLTRFNLGSDESIRPNLDDLRAVAPGALIGLIIFFFAMRGFLWSVSGSMFSETKAH